MIGQEIVEKILVPNSVHSRPEQEHSEKNCKKIQKLKKTSFWLYFLPNWDWIGQEREKKFWSQIPFLLNPGKKIPKKAATKFKK